MSKTALIVDDSRTARLFLLLKNPATATIPIMMYTAQEGELYVGQA